jgi:hypothetical protein
MNEDKSYATRTAQLKAKTLSVYHKLNPTSVEFAKAEYAQSELQTRKLGDQSSECCCVPPSSGSFNLTIGNYYTPPSPYNVTYSHAYNLDWNSIANATYSVTVSTTDPYLVLYTPGALTATVYVNFTGASLNNTVTATTPCGTVSSTQSAFPCFLAGTPVTMADGSAKLIEDVLVGDAVLGAFGEVNTVLALHRPLLGTALMCKINGEHSTTNHHPHVSADKKFYCNDPTTVDERTYGHEHEVLNEHGERVQMFLYGLKKGRVQQLELGVQLKTVCGSKTVETLETYSLPPETQLYNLVVGGSHTYHVDGYAVTGWPREDDFNYDSWVPTA